MLYQPVVMGLYLSRQKVLLKDFKDYALRIPSGTWGLVPVRHEPAEKHDLRIVEIQVGFDDQQEHLPVADPVCGLLREAPIAWFLSGGAQPFLDVVERREKEAGFGESLIHQIWILLEECGDHGGWAR